MLGKIRLDIAPVCASHVSADIRVTEATISFSKDNQPAMSEKPRARLKTLPAVLTVPPESPKTPRTTWMTKCFTCWIIRQVFSPSCSSLCLSKQRWQPISYLDRKQSHNLGNVLKILIMQQTKCFFIQIVRRVPRDSGNTVRTAGSDSKRASGPFKHCRLTIF